MANNEAALLARTDPLGSISSSLNPWFLRVYKEFKSNPVKNQPLRTAFSHTERILLELNKKGSLTNLHMKHRFCDMSRKVGDICKKELTRNVSDREIQCLAAFMGLVLPKSHILWRQYDGLMKGLIAGERCSIDSGLLAVSALACARKEGIYTAPLESNVAVLEMVSRRKASLHAEHYQGNVFETSDQVGNIIVNSTDVSKMSELFTQIGMNTVRDSQEVERLGALLNLLAVTELPRETHRAIILDVIAYGEKVLSTLQNPVRLNSLKVVWENAPDAQLMNSYGFYKNLYQQVLYSVTCEPLQLVQQGASIAKLLRSMLKSNFRSTQLLNKLHDIIAQQGIDCREHGMAIYNDLIQMDCSEFAMSVLNQYLDTTTSRHVKTELSDSAREQLLHRMAAKKSHELGDLVLLVMHGGATRATNGANNAASSLLHRVEVSVAQTIESLTLAQAVCLLRAYGTAGRLYPPVVSALNKIIARHATSQPESLAMHALWASAQLNDRSAEYIPALVDSYFKRAKTLTSLNSAGVYSLVNTLWSLTVLEKLELWQFELARGLIEGYVRARGGQMLHGWAVGQLQQVWNEAQILMAREEHRSGVAAERPSRCSDEDPLSILPWRVAKLRGFAEDMPSSHTHRDCSNILTQIGVSHKNEVTMPNGYVVDIFIPLSALPRAVGDDHTSGLTSKDRSGTRSGTGSGSTSASTAEWMRDLTQKSPERVAHEMAMKARKEPTAPKETEYLLEAGIGAKAEVGEEQSNTDGAPEAAAADLPAPLTVPCIGVVLEFDGPYHFESYMMVKALHLPRTTQ